MKHSLVSVLFSSLLVTASASAQHLDELPPERLLLLRNVSGTISDPGPSPSPLLFTRGAWTAFVAGSAHLTYTSESGPAEQRNEVFSTNWVSAGAQRNLGSRASLVVRGRVSAEQLTIGEDQGYPQILQWISAENGGPQIDRMRAHDFVNEAAVHLAVRTFGDSYLHLYGAAVGDPALGPIPYAVRASSMEFAEAPFAYDVQETQSTATRVITAGWSSRWFNIEASAFHDSTGVDSVDDGAIDSQSVRLTITPTRNVSLQLSRGELGDEVSTPFPCPACNASEGQRTVTSASLSYGNRAVAVSAIYTRRENQFAAALTSGTLEATYRVRRNTFMGRVESVDRPVGFLGGTEVERTTHMAVGYIFDFLNRPSWRTGAGFNFDYHTQTHALEEIYGHKPQSIYAFVRVRTGL